MARSSNIKVGTPFSVLDNFLRTRDEILDSVSFVDVEAGTTGTNFANHGVTHFGSSSGKAFTLAAPIKGVCKILYCTNAGSSDIMTVTTNSTGVLYTQTAGQRKLSFNAKDEVVVLVGKSTTQWMIVSNVNSVSVGTT